MEENKAQDGMMRQYFVDTAKAIIKEEGLKKVSVRNVARQAGYSYASIYHYFEDMSDLMFACVEDLCAEVAEFVDAKTGGKEGVDGVKAAVRAYAAYFTEYHGVFDLFFIEPMSGFGGKPETAMLITSLLDRLCEPHWEKAIAAGEVEEEKFKRARRQLRFVIPGIILYYENRMRPATYVEFVGEIELAINNSLK